MPDFEFEFNQDDKDLVVNQTAGVFVETDYIRLTIYPQEAIDNVVTLPGTDEQAIFYSSLSELPFFINVSPFGVGLDTLKIKEIGNGGNNDFKIYKNGESVYIKPNEIFNQFELPQGDYKLQIDFLNQLSPNSEIESDIDTGQGGGPDAETQGQTTNETIPNVHYQFIIKQISTSRKEVRLKLLNTNIINNSPIIEHIKEILNNGTNEYAFKHILNIGTGDHIPIMNFAFDAVTDGKDNQSIILKLYDTLPTNVGNLSMVTIEKEVLTTQTQDIFYFSDVPEVFFGDGLIPDEQENWINPDGNEVGFQNLNDLAISSSISDVELTSLISSSQYGYPNINTDFNEFTNHTHFGSAKTKIVNFKTKVETIQGYYSEISSSLVVSSSLDGDSPFVIQKRKNLFEKIQKEFKTFTPYETFLYFDGQNDSTASAPGLGKNYADIVPVTLSGEGIELGTTDGFKSVYKHSSEKVSGTHNQYIDLFTNKYQVHDKPFFNYSSSIYLSFLMMGDSGSSLRYENNNKTTHNGLDVLLPVDTKYQNNILNPDMTGSQYQRYIFEASQSYFVPNIAGNDLSDLTENDFKAGSTSITVLSGSVKTGSSQIKDSTNKYPTTVVSQSGVSFKGSVMPAGELFRIYNVNHLSSSLLGYYDYVDADIVTGGNDFEILDKSGNNNTLEFGGVGASADAFTSASIVAGVQGGDAFAFKVTGSEGTNQSGSMFLSTNGSTAPIEIAPISMSAVTGDAVTGFTMATYYKSTSTKPNTTIMSMDISTGSSIPFSGADAHGWNIQRLGDSIAGEVTREGVNIIDADTSEDGLRTGALTTLDGNFHHIAMTYDNLTGTGSLYFDGVLQNEGHSRGFITGSNQIYRLIVNTGPGSAQGYDDATFDETRFYTRALTPSEINQLYLTPDGITETKITDVKVSFNNPTDVLPFDNIYKTTSTEWTNWYNDILTKAENFDTDNIHSLENNLPLYIQNSSDYNDLKTFLSLQGEQYDLIKNHIDSLGTLNQRGYKKTDSPPDNTLPMLLSNMGWQAINPFSGSLTDSLGSYLTNVTTIDDIKNNTWRKTLNNLIYIYKSKGTKNSVRALLNTYGYPPDVINFQEFGGSTEESNPRVFTNQIPTNTGIDLSLDNATGSFSFATNKQKLYNYRVSTRNERVLNTDHYRNGADVETIQFVYKHVESTNDQILLKKQSHATLDQTLFDLRVVPSSDGVSSSFAFRLNNQRTGSLDISTNAVSMSTGFSKVSDGQLWNVMVQRMTSSVSGSGTNEYRLHAALQEDNNIKTYNYATMTVSGGLSNTYHTGSDVMTGSVDGQGYFANQNWPGTGSYSAGSTIGNLSFGGGRLSSATNQTTGSISELRGWSTPLSKSKFRQHVLNKFSTVGNTINSHKDELIYHFKLNENYSSASFTGSAQNLTIVDASPTTTYSDFSFNLSNAGEVTSSNVYGFDIVDAIRLTLQDNINKPNNNNILVNTEVKPISNLNPSSPAIESLVKPIGDKPRLLTSPKLEIYRSPQTFVDNFILDNISGFNLETLYGNPINYYSQSYKEFDTFRENFFDAHEIIVDTNKFIRAHESMFNESIIQGLKSVVPARSTFSDKNSNIGVEIRPTIIEKQKYENEEHSVEANPNTGVGSVDVVSTTHVPTSTFESIKEGIATSPVTSSATFEQPKTASINVNVTNTSTYEQPKQGSFSPLPSLTDSAVPTSKNGTIDYASIANESYESVHGDWGRANTNVHFINYAARTGSDLGSFPGVHNDYNVAHIDTRFNFYSIGDSEYYSASKGNASTFTNINNFYNHLQITDGTAKNVFYTHLRATAKVTNQAHRIGQHNTYNGKRMGKTRFMREVTNFDGLSGNKQLILPRNHVTKFSNPFKEQMIDGAQNTNPGFLNVRYEDYSSASFYRVKVTGGENQIRVQSGNPGLGSDDKIIYDDNSGGGGAL